MDASVVTALQHHSRIKYLLFLRRLGKKVYTPITKLRASVHTSDEPIPFKEAQTLGYESISEGDSWGGFFDCAWFKMEAKIAPDMNIENLVLRLDIDGEGCVYNENGAVQGITDVMGLVDRFQPAQGKQVVPLSKIGDIADGKILFYIDAGNNGRDGRSTGQAKLRRAELCVMRRDILDLYYDFLACYHLMPAVNDAQALREIAKAMDAAADSASDLSKENVIRARERLAPMFDGKYKEDFTVYAVGHGHLDLAWLWPVRETKRKTIRTFSNALYQGEQCPEYVFNGSQPQQYSWIKENAPELFERIKEGVKKGNIEPQGGMWVEADTNITGGESLIRQCYYGKNFFRKEFGRDVKTLWLPDVFGYSAALPQIIKKSGMDNFMTIKLSWNNINTFPYHTFRWTGLDNSEILVHMPPEGTYNSEATPYAFKKTHDVYKEKDISDMALMSFGIGDGGGGPGEYHVQVAKRCEKLRYIPEVKLSSSEVFFDELKKGIAKYPKYKGELYLEKHQGTYTTQSKIKKNNRKCESLMHFAEWICAEAHLKGMEYPAEKLEKIWKEMLLYHFHDILPGSSIHRVYVECNNRYAVLQRELNEIIDEAAVYMQGKKKELTAINSVGFRRDGYLKHMGRWYQYSLEPYSSGRLKKAPLPEGLNCSREYIENKQLRVVFNENGQITELVDKKNNYNCVKSLFNAVRIYKDRFVHPFNAWDIDINYTKQKPADMTLTETKAYIDGNSVVRENRFRYNESELVQRIILNEDSDYVKVENDVSWHETHKMLRIDAYPKNFGDKVLCDIQFGNLERSTKTDNKIDYAQFEIPAHKWVDVYDNGYGVGILNDCKYGHRVKNGLISLNCLRSPVYPDESADKGEHKFTYAIYPHKEEPMKSNLIKIGYELNNLVRVNDYHLLIKPFISCDKDNIIAETLMINDKGNPAVRLYETAGMETEAEVKLNIKSKEVNETNMLFENPIKADMSKLHFGPFEIKTLEIITK